MKEEFLDEFRPERFEKKNQCRQCKVPPFTWREARMQFSRLIRAGLTKEQAKAAGPMCGKCTTQFLKAVESQRFHALVAAVLSSGKTSTEA